MDGCKDGREVYTKLHDGISAVPSLAGGFLGRTNDDDDDCDTNVDN